MFPPLSKNERSKFSLGKQFRQQLDKLMNKLNATQTHYIRCIKPNAFKAARTIDAVMTLEQLRYSGVFEAVKIRKSGYPFRKPHSQFVHRYACLLPPAVAARERHVVRERSAADFSASVRLVESLQ